MERLKIQDSPHPEPKAPLSRGAETSAPKEAGFFTLNGKPANLSGVQTVADLLIHLGYQGKRVAVECNGQIVPRSLHAQTMLHDGDQLEVVVAVGGG